MVSLSFSSGKYTLEGNFQSGKISPLESVSVYYNGFAKLIVYDSKGREYANLTFSDSTKFTVGGALGDHTLTLLKSDGALMHMEKFKVDCKTDIRDSKGDFNQLLSTLYWTMVGKWGEAYVDRYDGKYYHYFVRWLRDHVHTLKGMKYFYPELKSGIDLYTDSQREDGMIWDNYYPRNYEKNWWDKRFTYGDFIRHADNGRKEFHRIPIEADVEYLYIEGLYYTWKATGDDQWMMGSLDNALKALEYSTSDPYRWSDKYKLVKRGFTIDTWDFHRTLFQI
jgi:hypothetical protein